MFVQVVKKSALRRRLSFHQIYRCTLLKIPSINELLSRFSGNRHLGGEKKKSVVLEKSAFQRSKQSWIEANCALKIIIFRYFAFLFRINFLFFIIYSFYILFEHDFFRYARAYRAYRQLRPWIRHGLKLWTAKPPKKRADKRIPAKMPKNKFAKKLIRTFTKTQRENWNNSQNNGN